MIEDAADMREAYLRLRDSRVTQMGKNLPSVSLTPFVEAMRVAAEMQATPQQWFDFCVSRTPEAHISSKMFCAPSHMNLWRMMLRDGLPDAYKTPDQRVLEKFSRLVASLRALDERRVSYLDSLETGFLAFDPLVRRALLRANRRDVPAALEAEANAQTRTHPRWAKLLTERQEELCSH